MILVKAQKSNEIWSDLEKDGDKFESLLQNTLSFDEKHQLNVSERAIYVQFLSLCFRSLDNDLITKVRATELVKIA